MNTFKLLFVPALLLPAVLMLGVNQTSAQIYTGDCPPGMVRYYYSTAALYGVYQNSYCAYPATYTTYFRPGVSIYFSYNYPYRYPVYYNNYAYRYPVYYNNRVSYPRARTAGRYQGNRRR